MGYYLYYRTQSYFSLNMGENRRITRKGRKSEFDAKRQNCEGRFHFLYCMQVSSIVTDYSYCGKIVMVTGSLALCSLI